MATTYRTSGATAVAQVTTIAVTGTWATSDTATLTVNGKDITFTVAGTDTTSAVVAGLVALWNDSTDPEFAEVTASGTSSPITLTGDTAGKPFTVTTDETTAGDGALGTPTDSTACAGPSFWGGTLNWSNGVPADSDTIIIDSRAGSTDIKYGLDQNAITPAVLTITNGFTGKIGLPSINKDNSSSTYAEYRDQYLILGNSGDAGNVAATIGEGSGKGSGRLKLDFGTGQATISIVNSGQATDSGIPAILLKGSHASNVLTVTKGDVGVAFFGGETAVIATMNVGYKTNIAGDAKVSCGNVTLTTINQSGGVITTDTNVTTMNMTGGEWIVTGGAITTLNQDAGAVRYLSSGTLTTANVGGGSVLDFRQSPAARTVTNCTVYEQFELYDPAGTVTWTNGIDFVRCTPAQGTFDVVPNRTWTPSTI